MNLFLLTMYLPIHYHVHYFNSPVLISLDPVDLQSTEKFSLIYH